MPILFTSALLNCVVICLYLLLSVIIGQGIGAASHRTKAQISNKHNLYWGLGTILLLATYIRSKKLNTINGQKSTTRNYPISNKNLRYCRDDLIILTKRHLNYLADLLNTSGDSDDHSSYKQCISIILSFQTNFQNIHAKMVTHEELLEVELKTLNDLLINKNIIIEFRETGVS